MYKLILQNVSDLFIKNRLVLTDQIDFISILTMLPEEGTPFKPVLSVPGTGIKKILTFIQYEQGLSFNDLATIISFMEVLGKAIKPVYI